MCFSAILLSWCLLSCIFRSASLIFHSFSSNYRSIGGDGNNKRRKWPAAEKNCLLLKIHKSNVLMPPSVCVCVWGGACEKALAHRMCVSVRTCFCVCVRVHAQGVRACVRAYGSEYMRDTQMHRERERERPRLSDICCAWGRAVSEWYGRHLATALEAPS